MRGTDGSDAHTLTVPVQTIDHIFGEDTPPAVKIDVEGMENLVLKQMLESGKTPPVIFVDFDSICCCIGEKSACAKRAEEGEDVLKRLQSAGYERFELKNRGEYTFWRNPEGWTKHKKGHHRHHGH
jgi:hypothetical protein